MIMQSHPAFANNPQMQEVINNPQMLAMMQQMFADPNAAQGMAGLGGMGGMGGLGGMAGMGAQPPTAPGQQPPLDGQQPPAGQQQPGQANQ
jgi:hypothetical protein